MDVMIFAESPEEYEELKLTLSEAIPRLWVKRCEDDGHYHFGNYDAAVIAKKGAKGMEYVREYRIRYPKMPVIWITDDEYFAGVAIRRKVFDFIVRPYDKERILEAAFKLAEYVKENSLEIED